LTRHRYYIRLWPYRHQPIYVREGQVKVPQTWLQIQNCQVGNALPEQLYFLTFDSTWRTLIPVLEDRPLALCDSRSVDPADLVAADRIIPNNVGEVYYLTYNPNHKWYWLEKQTQFEIYAFLAYDTKSGDHARCEYSKFSVLELD
jgi:hypothetical protein